MGGGFFFFFFFGNLGVFFPHDGMDIFPETKNQTTEMTMWGVAVNGSMPLHGTPFPDFTGERHRLKARDTEERGTGEQGKQGNRADTQRRMQVL